MDKNLIPLTRMIDRCQKLAVESHNGTVLMPVFDYDWYHVIGYKEDYDAMFINLLAWIGDHAEWMGEYLSDSCIRSTVMFLATYAGAPPTV